LIQKDVDQELTMSYTNWDNIKISKSQLLNNFVAFYFRLSFQSRFSRSVLEVLLVMGLDLVSAVASVESGCVIERDAFGPTLQRRMTI